MSFPIIFTSTNRISGSIYRLSLPSVVDLSDYDVAVGQAYLYYSWYSISSANQNNTYQFVYPTSAGSTTYTVVIPDGAYNISDLNAHLQYFCIQNGLYITNNTTGLNTYYLSFQLSPTAYNAQFISTALPTSLPAGYTSGGMTFPASANQAPQLIIAAAPNSFRFIVGMNAGTYPSSPTISGSTYTKPSDFTPAVNPISAIQVRLNCVFNPFSGNSNLVHVFTNRGAAFGAQIDASPLQLQFVPCQGSHKELTLSFADQLGNPMNILDPALTFKLLFKKRKTAQ